MFSTLLSFSPLHFGFPFVAAMFGSGDPTTTKLYLSCVGKEILPTTKKTIGALTFPVGRTGLQFVCIV